MDIKRLYDHIIQNISESVYQMLNEQSSNPDYIVPTVQLMTEWFDEFNKQFFNNELPKIKLKVGNCGSTTFGCFRVKRSYYSYDRKWAEPFNPDKCSITLSNLYAMSEHDLKNVMIHEMVHYWICYHYNYDPARIHGREFLYEARKINSKSEWNITPTSDNTNADITAYAAELYKNRISDEYIICTFEYYNQYGFYHALRTSEKYMESVIKTLIRWKCKNVKWYKMKTDNPKFGINERINRGGMTLTFIASGYSTDEVFKKITDNYGECEFKEFTPADLETGKLLYLYVTTDKKYSDAHCACKLEDIKYYEKLTEKCAGYESALYKVEHYNDVFNIAYPSKTRCGVICNAYSYKDFVKKLKDQYDIDFEKLEKIK